MALVYFIHLNQYFIGLTNPRRYKHRLRQPYILRIGGFKNRNRAKIILRRIYVFAFGQSLHHLGRAAPKPLIDNGYQGSIFGH